MGSSDRGRFAAPSAPAAAILNSSPAPTSEPIAAPEVAGGAAVAGTVERQKGLSGATRAGTAHRSAAPKGAMSLDPLDTPAPEDAAVGNLWGGAHGAKGAGKPEPPKKADDAKSKRPSEEKPAPAPPRVAIAKGPLGQCSDAANRPLAERVALWKKRLDQVTTASESSAQFDAAYQACELPDWRDRAALLDLLQRKVDTEQGAEIMLQHFAYDFDARDFLARALLRRTVDVRIAAAVSRALFGSRVDWPSLDRELLDIGDADKRLLKLRTAMLAAPGDPAGEVRLVRLLAKTGNFAEALAHGRRLRDRGFATPTLAEQLGDVLAEEHLNDEAMRTYSELVEFDQANLASRRLLGDIYLRHGWYAEAYRQYKGLTTSAAREATDWIRLARAAAGAGRVDEALRIERDVASNAGQPGPSDPRYFARLWSAAHLGLLLDGKDATSDKPARDAVGRKLKDLHLFTGPGTLALLTWEDLDARLVLASADEKKETLAGDAIDAGSVGLASLVLSPSAWDKGRWAVRFTSDRPDRDVKFTVVTLTWNNEAFSVTTQQGEVPRGTKQAPLN